MSFRSGWQRTALFGATVVVLAAAILAVRSRDEAPPVQVAMPEPAELDSLTRYLQPVQPAPPIDSYEAYLPATLPPRRLPQVAMDDSTEAPIGWTLSAILISGERPLAIINDQQVRPGGRLPGGAEVVTIERDHVIIREPNGIRRTLWLRSGDAA